MISLENSVDELERQSYVVLDRVVADLYNELVRVTPVDTGQLKTSWALTKKDKSWTISNNMEYASVIFDGRRLVAGKTYGSNQLPAGIDPVLAKYNIILSRDLDKIRI